MNNLVRTAVALAIIVVAMVGVMTLMVLAGFPADAAGMRHFANVPLSQVPQAIRDGQQQAVLEAGFLDINRAPYNADPTGVADSTAAWRQAIDDGYRYNFVVHGSGSYRLTGGLVMRQLLNFAGGASNRKFAPQVHCAPGTVLQFGPLGTGVAIDIRFESSPGVEDTGLGPTRLYNTLLRGCIIDGGGVNTDARGVKNNAAQWATLEDLTIRGFGIGIDGAPGSGGSMTNVTVEGGRIGWRQQNYRPTPSCQGCRFLGQSDSGVRIEGVRNAVVLTGVEIRSDVPGARGVVATARGAGQPARNIAFLDGVIDVPGTAIDAVGSNIYANNVFVRSGSGTIMRNGTVVAPVEVITEEGWQRIEELAFVEDGQGNNAPLWVNGMTTPPDGLVLTMALIAAPPDAETLLRRHAWEPHSLPSWWDGPVLDVRAFGATPDVPGDDDAPAFHSAFAAALAQPRDERQCVFVPRGFFDMRQPVEVPAGVCLLGSSFTNSVIQASPAWKPTGPTALVRTQDVEGELLISDIAITGHEGAACCGLESHKHMTMFHGRTSNMLLRDTMVTRREYWSGSQAHLGQPFFVLSGNAGGRVYNGAFDLFISEIAIDPAYRMILVDGTTHPLAIYQPDTEGGRSNPQTEIRGARDVLWSALKFESPPDDVLHIVDSRNILVLGGSGNYDAIPGAMVDVRGGQDVTVALIGRQGSVGTNAVVKVDGVKAAGDVRLAVLARKGGLWQTPQWPGFPFQGEPPPLPPSPPVASLTVEPDAIRPGDSATLSWTSARADSCVGTGFDAAGATEGSLVVSPPVTTIYEVACAGEGGTATASAALTVLPPPGEAVTITDVEFDWATYDRLALGSDNWPCTWADDDNLYCAWGDGGGFGGTNNNGRVSLGFARVEGPHDAYVGHNVWGGLDGENPATHGGKSYAIVSVDGVLYAWGCLASSAGTDGCTRTGERITRLWRSDDHGAHWSSTGHDLFPDRLGRAFAEGNFVNVGRDHAGAPDGYVYAVWPGERSDHYQGNSTGAYLTRVPAAQVGDLGSYEYFAGMAGTEPSWAPDIALREHAFSCEIGTRCVGWAPSMVYIAPLQKYLFIGNSNPSPGGLPPELQTNLEFWQADAPWGPWTLVKQFVDWRPTGATATDRYQFFFDIPTKWVSADGLDFTFMWTGRGRFDAWNAVRARFTIAGEPPDPPLPVPTATLSAAPDTIQAGQSSTLTWGSTDATGCSGSGFEAGATLGTATVQPAATTTYRVECAGEGGTAEASTTVTVEPAPGPDCREYWHGVQIEGVSEPILTGTACRGEDGRWRIKP